MKTTYAAYVVVVVVVFLPSGPRAFASLRAYKHKLLTSPIQLPKLVAAKG